MRSGRARRRWALLAIVACLCAEGSVRAEDNVVVRRTTLLVADLEKSIAFYEALGFARSYDRATRRQPEAKMALPLNVAPARSRLVIMKGRDPWIGMVGLLAYDEPRPPSNRVIAEKIGAGDSILMIETADARASYDRIMSLGVRSLQPPAAFEAELADGSKISGINFFVVYHDGRVIEASQPQSRGDH
jgi:catechol 2,3-dioxygenase-like lactoylglutathione lyase family enzyme